MGYEKGDEGFVEVRIPLPLQAMISTPGQITSPPHKANLLGKDIGAGGHPVSTHNDHLLDKSGTYEEMSSRPLGQASSIGVLTETSCEPQGAVDTKADGAHALGSHGDKAQGTGREMETAKAIETVKKCKPPRRIRWVRSVEITETSKTLQRTELANRTRTGMRIKTRTATRIKTASRFGTAKAISRAEELQSTKAAQNVATTKTPNTATTKKAPFQAPNQHLVRTQTMPSIHPTPT